MSTGDTINVTNSNNVNIKSTLTQVNQNVGNLSAATDEQKETLKALVQQLADELAKAPNSQAKAAETVLKRTSQLVDEAASDAPDPSMLTAFGTGLRNAADFVKTALPAVATITAQIVSLVGNLHGLPL